MSTAGHRHLRRGGPEQEDASILKLGEEFDKSQCLYISEVRILLEAQEESKESGKESRPITNVMSKTLEHVQAFGRFNNREPVIEVRQLLGKNPELSQFEIAQLANLCCEDAEEAKALIPSLANKMEDEKLQELLNQMITIRKFQG
ncbi:HRDC-like protein [Halteromyces radiatus]|uniref:HRDC-like protein n=1 Tax=Halteromyces radiatus TaxID=101107 RepID=UPI00222036F9|nr:HRDC-like protein [Halteromyces radiatus]KAI8099107.1 HRDC-like protein [Halteromyces radiatus]